MRQYQRQKTASVVRKKQIYILRLPAAKSSALFLFKPTMFAKIANAAEAQVIEMKTSPIFGQNEAGLRSKITETNY